MKKSSKIKFCHISPTAFLKKYTAYNDAHLLLAHLIAEDPEYKNFYASLKDDKYKIMDNSAFEMFKLGKPMMASEKLIGLAKEVKAHCIVMSDYPKQDYRATVDAAKHLAPFYKSEGFDTFFVPQSELGDMDGLMKSIEWGLNNEQVDIIGISILSAPIACGVNESTFEGGARNDAYKMQRYLSRLTVFREMEKRNLLNKYASKRFHCLGMVDGPKEIDLLREYSEYIFSWDSSAAVWAGMHDIRFDSSPTGLMYGKFEKEVDFHCSNEHNPLAVIDNIVYIDKLIEQNS